MGLPSVAEGGPEDPRELLDTASSLGTSTCQYLGFVSSWSLALPTGLKWAAPSPEWRIELGERLLSSVLQAQRGWFFESWEPPAGPDSLERGLSSCLEHAWLDFRRADQVIQPVGKHTH